MSEPKQVEVLQTSSKRRPSLLGPCTIFMTICLLVIGGFSLLQAPKVTIERQVKTSGELNFRRKPTAFVLLSWTQELSLRPAQKEFLKNLLKEEQIRLKPVESEIGKVLVEFNQFAAKQVNKSAGMQEFEAAAQPISELSREKRQIQQSFAEQALSILDEKQKDKAGQLLEVKLAQKTVGSKEAPIRDDKE